MNGRRRARTAVTIDKDLYYWVKSRTGTGGKFHNFSHAVDIALAELKAKIEEEERLLETARKRET